MPARERLRAQAASTRRSSSTTSEASTTCSWRRSTRRAPRAWIGYRAEVDKATTAEQLAEVAATGLSRKTATSGHMTVVSQMVAGSVAKPELATELAGANGALDRPLRGGARGQALAHGSPRELTAVPLRDALASRQDRSDPSGLRTLGLTPLVTRPSSEDRERTEALVARLQLTDRRIDSQPRSDMSQGLSQDMSVWPTRWLCRTVALRYRTLTRG